MFGLLRRPRDVSVSYSSNISVYRRTYRVAHSVHPDDPFAMDLFKTDKSAIKAHDSPHEVVSVGLIPSLILLHSLDLHEKGFLLSYLSCR